MDTELPKSNSTKLQSAPKAWVGDPPKPARLRAFSTLPSGQCGPRHWPSEPGPSYGQPGAFPGPPRRVFGALHVKPEYAGLGPPLDIRAVACLIGCSPWTVRQTLIPRGLPFFRSAASGRLIFYTDQVIRWIESQQQGGKTTK